MPRRRTISIAAGVLLALAALWAGASWLRQQQREHLERQWPLVQVGMTEPEVETLLGKPATRLLTISFDDEGGLTEGADESVWCYGQTRHYRLRRRQSFPYIAIDVSRSWDGAVAFDRTSDVSQGEDQTAGELRVRWKGEFGRERYGCDWDSLRGVRDRGAAR